MTIFENAPGNTADSMLISAISFLIIIASCAFIHDTIIPLIHQKLTQQIIWATISIIIIIGVISIALVLVTQPKLNLTNLHQWKLMSTQIGYQILSLTSGIWISISLLGAVVISVNALNQSLNPSSQPTHFHQNNLDQPTKQIRK